MAKPKTLRDRAIAWQQKHMPSHYQDAVVKSYIAGHRAGSRLTKAEREVVKAAKYWRDSDSIEAGADLIQALDNFHAEKVRK